MSPLTKFSSTFTAPASISSMYVPDYIFPPRNQDVSQPQILQAQGKYQNQPPLPFVLGTEFAGRISPNSPIPEGCPYKPGDRVFGATQGTYADKVAVKWRLILPLPHALTYDQGAGAYPPTNVSMTSRLMHNTTRPVYHMANELRSIGRTCRTEARYVRVDPWLESRCR